MQDDINKNKTGPKPKQLVEGTIIGLAVGRDRTVVPPEQVLELSELGCTDKEIAGFFGIKEDTLRYNFAEILAKGKESVKIKLRRAMMKNATENLNASVQIFLAKNYLGMSDQPISSEANAPLPWTEGDTVTIEEIDDETDTNENNT